MPLTDVKVKAAQPKDKPYKLSDGQNLFLLIKPNGGKYWRYRYHWLQREKTMALGVYPDISLREARERRDDARKLKAKGIDPSELKRQQKELAIAQDKTNFASIAREWHELRKDQWSPYYARQVMQRLENDVFPKIGHRPISSITAKDTLLNRRVDR